MKSRELILLVPQKNWSISSSLERHHLLFCLCPHPPAYSFPSPSPLLSLLQWQPWISESPCLQSLFRHLTALHLVCSRRYISIRKKRSTKSPCVTVYRDWQTLIVVECSPAPYITCSLASILPLQGSPHNPYILYTPTDCHLLCCLLSISRRTRDSFQA